ncbi:hypothetical protein [Usitatibacter palustris]|uniref:Big-1 domain-containing protein n=1 Tax=Usitatibacter palustris TaxID=2732487 RepID=A0A6M4H905_9PROT|nr:hypothetical protein [Usitatibacter palustris]QJR16219.1 hypothetical protein DSM104440_03048 [Usitatibacter palustris]
MKTALRSFVLGLALVAGLDAAATVSVLPGSSPQTINNGDYFAPLRVRVTDASGQPVPDAIVYWTLPYRSWAILAHESHANCTTQDGVGDNCAVYSGVDGTAELNTSYAVYAGTHTIRVFARTFDQTSELGFTEINLTVTPHTPPAATLREFGQSNRTGIRGRVLERPFGVTMLNLDGTPRVGAAVTFSRGDIFPAGAAGLFAGEPTATAITDDAGYAESPEFRITSGIGLGRIVARALDTTSSVVLEVNFYFTSTMPDGSTSVSVEDLWWAGPDESGWGLSIAQRGEQLFSVVFAYDAAGKPTWYALDQGQYASDALYEKFNARAYSPTGSPYFSYDASRFVPGPPGAVTQLQFYDENEATLRMTFGDRVVSKSIRRFDFSGTSGFPPFANITGTYWGGASQNGWAVAISEKNNALFAVWYTYDASGNRTWFSMTGGQWINQSTYLGTIYQTSGPQWPGYDSSLLVAKAVGSFALTFGSSNAVIFDWIIGERSARHTLQRYVP